MKNVSYFITPIFYLLFSVSLNAQPGNLDGDFDSDGTLTVDFDSQADEAYAVAVQPDGKIIVAGHSRIQGDDDFAMARFNTDGTYDATFGTGGKATTSFSSGDDLALAMLLQPDGKIILAGHMNNGTLDFAMARYTTSGALDNTFSNDGILFTDFNNLTDVCYAAALQPDGKIILAGKSGQPNYDFALARYNADGTLDNTFGAGGKVITVFTTGAASSIVNAVAVQSDGKIVAAGQYLTDGGSHSSFALARYNEDGTLDNTFSVDGKITTDLGSTSGINSIALQSNGYIIAGGYSGINSNGYMALARYKTDGTLDTGFDGDGKFISDAISFLGQAYEVLLQTDGKIIAAGYGLENVNAKLGMIRFEQNGLPDNTFGSGGTVYTTINSGENIAYAAAIQPDLKIVLAGITYNGSNYDFAVARYLSGLNLGTLEFSTNTSALIYPNPLNETTVLSFELATNDLLNISIYNMQGTLIKSLNKNQFYSSGKHQLSIDAASLATGQYLLVLENGKGKNVIRLQK